MARLCDVAVEAKARFHARQDEYDPEAVATRNVAPERHGYHNGYQEPI
ncbi:hypothetical protein [Flaviflexus salsibiostraticola]|nr:hypothetical protein [Flaviflexus salsibiostraticola]